jgi:hypothetical protein
LGSAPASPAPNKNRIRSKSTKPLNTTPGSGSQENRQTQPVSAVKADHQSTMRISTRREPKRSPQWPVVGSKMA